MDRVIWSAHPSWRGMVLWYVKGLVVAAVAIAAAYGLEKLDVLSSIAVTSVAVVGVALVIVGGYIKKLRTTYTITEHFCQEKRGLLNTTQSQAQVSKITNVILERSIFARILGIGHITIDTANEDEPLAWWGIGNPDSVVAILDKLRMGEDPTSAQNAD